MHRTLRTSGRIVGWTVAALFAVVITACLAVQTPFAKQYILEGLVDRANADLRGELQVDELDGSLLWGADLHDVRLRDARGGAVLRIPRVELDYSIFELLGEETDIRDVRVERPLLVVRRYADGAVNLTNVLEPGPSAALDFQLLHYTVEEGGIVYTDRADGLPDRLRRAVRDVIDAHFQSDAPVDVSPLAEVFPQESRTGEGPRVAYADGVDLEGGLRRSAEGKMQLPVEGLEFRAEAETFDGAVNATAEGIRFVYEPDDRLGFRVDRVGTGDTSRLTGLEGMVDWRAGDARGTSVGLRVDELTVAPPLASNIGDGVPLAAPVTATGEIGGRLTSLGFSGKASVPGGGSFSLMGTCDWTAADYRARLKMTDLRPGVWTDLPVPETSFDAAGSIDGDGWSPAAMRTEVSVSAREARVGPYAIDDLTVEGTVGAESPERWIEVSTLDLESPYLMATGRGHLTSDGEFTVEASGETPEDGLPASLAQKWGVAAGELGDASLSAEASGVVDVDRPRFPDIIRRFEVSADWKMGTVVFETAKVASSEGTLDLRLAANGDGDDGRGVRLEATGDVRELALPSYRLASGSWRARGDADLDLDAGTVPDGLSSLSLETNVAIEGLSGPDVGARSVRMSLRAGRESPHSPITYGLDGTLAEASHGHAAVASTELDLTGTVESAEAGDRWFRRVSATGTMAGEGVESSAWRVDGFESDVAFDGPPFVPDESVEYEVSGTATRPSNGTFSAETATFEASGSAVPADGELAWEQFAADGSLDLEALRGFGFRIGGIDTDFEWDGPLSAPVGHVQAAVEKFGVGDVRFGGAEVDLDLERGRQFDLQTASRPMLTPDLPFVVRLGGGYGDGPSPYAVESLEVGRPGLMWELLDPPGRIMLDEQTVTVDSVALGMHGRRVELDGTYARSDIDSMPALIRRLGLTKLRGTFDPETLRKELPERYRKRLPEDRLSEPEEAVKEQGDAVRERLRDEVEKQLEDVVGDF